MGSLPVISTVTRIDRGVLGKPKIVKPEGYLVTPAVFAVDGVLRYPLPESVRKEFRSPEVNKRIAPLFRQQVFTIDHPSTLLDSSTAASNFRGITTDNIIYLPEDGNKPGMVVGEVKIMDQGAIDLIMGGTKRGTSAAYRCQVLEETGSWRGDSYGFKQIEPFEINHIAACDNPRAGPHSKVCLDEGSQKSDNFIVDFSDEEINYQIWRLDSVYGGSKKLLFEIRSLEPVRTINPKSDSRKMTTTTYRLGNVEYADVPIAFASAVDQALARFTELNAYKDELEDSIEEDQGTIEELEESLSNLEELEIERDRAVGRGDELETLLWKADEVLAELGYSIGDDGEYYLDECGGKKGKKKKYGMEEDYDEEDEEGEYEEEEYEELKAKKKRKNTDSVSTLFKTWVEGERLVPGVMQSQYFDETLGSSEVKSLILSLAAPDKFDSIKQFSEGKPAIQEVLTEFIYADAIASVNTTPKNDSELTQKPYEAPGDRSSNFSSLDLAISRASTHPNNSEEEDLASNWQQPLTFSCKY